MLLRLRLIQLRDGCNLTTIELPDSHGHFFIPPGKPVQPQLDHFKTEWLIPLHPLCTEGKQQGLQGLDHSRNQDLPNGLKPLPVTLCMGFKQGLTAFQLQKNDFRQQLTVTDIRIIIVDSRALKGLDHTAVIRLGANHPLGVDQF